MAARDGDERALTTLIDAYQRPVQAYVTRMVGNAVLAEDLTQDIFLRVFSRLSTFRGQSAFTTWLFQIAKNRVVDELRAQTRRPSEAPELSDSAVPNPEHADHARDTDETIAAIWRAVSQLNLDLKTTLLLRDVAGLSYREIAATLEIELSTVKWRIYTARETIQRSLATQGLSPHYAHGKHQHDPQPKPQQTTEVAFSPTR